MRPAGMRMAALTAALFALFAAPARAEAVRDLVDILGAPPIILKGVGLVTGLPNTGDKKDAALETLRGFLDSNGMSFDAKSLGTGNLALVMVTAEMPPFSRPGQKFPVKVSSIGDAKNLAGGELIATNLTALNYRDGDGDDIVLAVAHGRITVGTNMPTTGVVPPGDNSGAYQIAAYPEGNVIWPDRFGNNILRLNLKSNSYADASAIARQINQTPSLNPFLQEATMFAESEPSRWVAIAKDPVQVAVYIPPQFMNRHVDYIRQVLDVPVAVDRPARIVVNRAKNSIVVTGDVRVSNAVVSLQDKTVTIRPETDEAPAGYALENDAPRAMAEIDGPGSYAELQSLIDTLSAMGLTTDQIINLFEELIAAKAVRAELVAR